MVIISFNLTEIELEERVNSLAGEIVEYFTKRNIKDIYLIFILTSSFVFASDLMRKLSKLGLVLQTNVISVKSYVGTESKNIKTNIDDIYRNQLDNKDILIVDDILDTGKTLTYVREQILEHYKPKTMEFCCLLNKVTGERDLKFEVRFIGFNIPDAFVIGYGLDCEGRYRELSYITTIDQVQRDIKMNKIKKNKKKEVY